MKDDYSYLTISYDDKNAVSLQPESEKKKCCSKTAYTTPWSFLVYLEATLYMWISL